MPCEDSIFFLKLKEKYMGLRKFYGTIIKPKNIIVLKFFLNKINYFINVSFVYLSKQNVFCFY